MQAGDAPVEPEAGDRGEVGGARGEVEQDAYVATTGLMDEIVEVVNGSQGGVDRLGVGGVGLDGGEEKRVDSQRVEIVEALGEAVEGAAFGGAEVGGVYVVDDSVFPPGVGAHAGASPAGTGEGLCWSGGEGAGEKESEESERSLGHTLLLECYARILHAESMRYLEN
jgi:hypothetical protein